MKGIELKSALRERLARSKEINKAGPRKAGPQKKDALKTTKDKVVKKKTDNGKKLKPKQPGKTHRSNDPEQKSRSSGTTAGLPSGPTSSIKAPKRDSAKTLTKEKTKMAPRKPVELKQRTKGKTIPTAKPQGNHSQQKHGERTKDQKERSSDWAKNKASKGNDGSQLTKFQQAMAKHLEGAQFRWLNEQLYTMEGHQALKLMKQQPHLFDLYHTGFRVQANSWPENPVDVIRAEIEQLIPKGAVIADIGCGEAMLAQALQPLGYTVHSFDLVERPPYVKAADMAHLPLPDGVCDVAVFSLSLMNSNWGQGAAEGVRILKKGGIMKIAEVVSRIPVLDDFIASLESLGLQVINKNTKNPMFVMINLRKKVQKKVAPPAFAPLKPCIYKKR